MQNVPFAYTHTHTICLQLIELDTKNRNAMVIQQMPPIATKYFLAGFFCAWKNSELGIIKSLIDPPLTVAISNEQIVIAALLRRTC